MIRQGSWPDVQKMMKIISFLGFGGREGGESMKDEG
jgi:hypothetical protein